MPKPKPTSKARLKMDLWVSPCRYSKGNAFENSSTNGAKMATEITDAVVGDKPPSRETAY